MASLGTRLDYAAILAMGTAKRLVAAWRRDPARTFVDSESGCWRSLVSLNAGGYTSVRRHADACHPRRRRRNAGHNLLLHRLAFLSRKGRDVRPGMVASHLCGVRACFNPEHIVEESQSVNLSRCRSACPGILSCDACSAVVAVSCSHSPLCLRSHSYAVLCKPCAAALGIASTVKEEPTSKDQKATSL